MNTIQTPQKYVPRLHLKSQLRLRPSVKFQMHILAPSDKRLPKMQALEGSHEEAVIQRKALRRGKNSNLAFSGVTCLGKQSVGSEITPRKVGVGLKRKGELKIKRWGWRLAFR